MDFELLQSRLVASLRWRVQSGDTTERGLARLTGISQPHLHHVLKGFRSLSPDAADQILRRLRISLLDLCEPEELAAHIHSPVPAGYLEVPLLEGWIGPGRPFPARESSLERYPFPCCEVACLSAPAGARVGADCRLRHLFRAGDLILLDRRETARLHPAPQCYYAIQLPASSLIRHARLEGQTLCLFAENASAWSSISLRDRNILEIVRAKVFWIGHYLEPPPFAKRPSQQARPEY